MMKDVAEFAYDLHAGLASHQIADFDDLHTIGMAATLAIHIKGLGEIEYEVLRKVSDFYMSIPSIALEKTLRILSEIGFVKLIESGRRIDKVIPDIPVFDDVYQVIGSFANSEMRFNSHEQATIEILNALKISPHNRDSLLVKTGIDKSVYDRCLVVADASGIVSEHKARGKPMLISPFYFADNLDSLADAAAAVGAGAIQSTLKKDKGQPRLAPLYGCVHRGDRRSETIHIGTGSGW
jgi:hypothetical protein